VHVVVTYYHLQQFSAEQSSVDNTTAEKKKNVELYESFNTMTLLCRLSTEKKIFGVANTVFRKVAQNDAIFTILQLLEH